MVIMNIKCCICHELFIPSDDVYFTPCGHFFHFPCVSHWLERSKSCPHCRTKVTGRSIHRAYFDFANTDDTQLNTTVLTSQIDTLNLKILLKDQDIKTCGEENATLKIQTAGLRAEVRKLEGEIEKYKSVIYALKEQVKFLHGCTADTDAAKKEVVRLKKNLQELRNVQMLITNSQDEVDRMLSDTQDITALITYVSVMKREMESNVQRRRELREKIKRLEREIVKFKSERNHLLQQETKYRQLEENLAHCENEKKSLWKKLEELKKQLSSERKISSEDVHRFIAESPAPEKLEVAKQVDTVNITSDCDATFSDMSSKPKCKKTSPMLSRELKCREKSLDLSVNSQKSSNHYELNQQSHKLRPLSSLSILTKKPKLTAPSKASVESKQMHYDGYGGHSKVDDYSNPILRFKPKVLKKNLMSVKVKRRKLSDGSNKKLENYFIDLT